MTDIVTDIVEGLRDPEYGLIGLPLVKEAADEIERLEHMKANLHGHIKRLEDENTKLRAERNSLGADLLAVQRECIKLREALEKVKNTYGRVGSIARATLQKDEGE